MSSFNYVLQDTEACKEGRKYWNERNMRMAKNIANQIEDSTHERNLVVVGAAHVIGLEKELKTKYPNLKVILMNEY
jgi:pheromone shutdown protein TraB